MPGVKESYRCKYDSSSCSDISSDSDTSSDSDFFEMVIQSSGTRNSPEIKVRGEVLDDLPPLEDLNITEDDMMLIGNVYNIVDKLVVVRAVKNVNPLNINSVLFLTHNKALGHVCDVFGSMTQPYYCVSFNSIDDIKEKGIKIGDEIFFAPNKDSITSYVSVDQLLNKKRSDASWRENNEPPEECLVISDDEQENATRQKNMTEKKNLQFSNSLDMSPKRQSLMSLEYPMETSDNVPKVPSPHLSPPQDVYRTGTPGQLKRPLPPDTPPKHSFTNYEVNQYMPSNHPTPGMKVRKQQSDDSINRPNFKSTPNAVRLEYSVVGTMDNLPRVPSPYLFPPQDAYRTGTPRQWKRPLPPDIPPKHFCTSYEENQNMPSNHPLPGMNFRIQHSDGSINQPNFKNTPNTVRKPALQHSMASASSWQHSAPSVCQSEMLNFRPTLPLIHQPLPFGNYGWPPTLSGLPTNPPPQEPLAFVSTRMTSQRHPFSASYAGTSHPEVILPQPTPRSYPTAPLPQPNLHLRNQTLGFTPYYVTPHAPVATVLNCAAIVPNSNNGGSPTMAINASHYVPHSQSPRVRRFV